MARINPRQIQYIKEIQPDFEFQERKIQPSLDVASSDDLFKVDQHDGNELDTMQKPKSVNKVPNLPRSFSNGNLYKQLGFNFINKTRPNSILFFKTYMVK